MSVVPSLWLCLPAVTSRAATKHFCFIKCTVSPLFFCFNPLASSRSVASSNVMFFKKESPRLLQLECNLKELTNAFRKRPITGCGDALSRLAGTRATQSPPQSCFYAATAASTEAVATLPNRRAQHDNKLTTDRVGGNNRQSSAKSTVIYLQRSSTPQRQ